MTNNCQPSPFYIEDSSALLPFAVSSRGHNSRLFLPICANFSHFIPSWLSQPVSGTVQRAGSCTVASSSARERRAEKRRGERIFKHISDYLENKCAFVPQTATLFPPFAHDKKVRFALLSQVTYFIVFS